MTENVSAQSSPSEDWDLLQWQEYLLSIHSKNIDLGLARLLKVFANMTLSFAGKTVITVAGTNGKGTTCACLEQLLLRQGKRVGVYSSPHIQDYRERVRVNGQILSEEEHCQSLMRVEQIRDTVSLTFFEFGTLAAFDLLSRADIDVVLLEIGLGGRLDAVNIVEPDISLITTVDLDHQDWLGDNREVIGAEKAGVMRADKPAIIGDFEPPESVIAHAKKLNCEARYQLQDFHYHESAGTWTWQGTKTTFQALPKPAIPLQNASTALATLEALDWLPTETQLQQWMGDIGLAGRFQRIATSPTIILDVAHNPQATSYLTDQLKKLPHDSLYAVVAMLEDKDIEASLAPLQSLGVKWLTASLHVPRGATCDKVSAALVGQHVEGQFRRVSEAIDKAQELATEQDVIVVFGSFFTVAEATQHLAN